VALPGSSGGAFDAVASVSQGKVNEERHEYQTAPRSGHRSAHRRRRTEKRGDQILFGKYTSQEVKLNGEEYLIMREDEVLAVIGGGTTHKQ
jgi:co-chaperonin GroES (HSP10)